MSKDGMKAEVDLPAQGSGASSDLVQKAKELVELHPMSDQEAQNFQKAIRQLRKAELNEHQTGILTRQGYLGEKTIEEMSHHTWLENFIHGNSFQIFLIVLLCLDVACVIGELVLEVEICRYNGFESSHRRSGGGGEPAWMTDMSIALRWISLSILFIFGAEILTLLCLMRKRFFENGFLILDFVIVGASISLDFLFHHSEESGLIVFLRFWRFVRVAHGIFMSEHEGTVKNSELAKHSIDLLLKVNKEMRTALKSLTRDEEANIDALEAEMRNCHCFDEVVGDPSHPVTTILKKLRQRDGEIYQLQKELKRFVTTDKWGVDVQYKGLNDDFVHREEAEAEVITETIAHMPDNEEKKELERKLKVLNMKIKKHIHKLEDKTLHDEINSADKLVEELQELSDGKEKDRKRLELTKLHTKIAAHNDIEIVEGASGEMWFTRDHADSVQPGYSISNENM